MRIYILRGILLCVLFLYALHSDAIQYPAYSQMKKKPWHLKPLQYVKWVESQESGLTANATSGILDFRLMYRPLDYIVLKENLVRRKEVSRKQLKNSKSEIEDMEYYTFSISLNDGRKDLIRTLAPDNYEALLLYFANDMQRDLKLARGKDTVDCALYHFERTYGLTPSVTCVLGFSKAEKRKDRRADRTLLFDARVFKSHKVKLHLRKEDIHTIPGIHF